MTRRELINQLLDGDMNEEIHMIIYEEEEGHSCYPITWVCGNVIAYEDDEDK